MVGLASWMWMWTAVYAFASAYHFVLWARVPSRQPELPSYAALCVGLGIHSAGAALQNTSGARMDQVFATELCAFGCAAAAFGFAEFASFVSRAPSLIWTTRLGLGLSLILVLTDQVVSGGPPETTRLSTLARCGALLLLSASVASLGLLAHAQRRRHDTCLVALAAGVSLLGASNEVLRLWNGMPSRGMLAMTCLPSLLAVSFAILRRTLGASRELENKTRELSANVDALVSARNELVRSEPLAAVGELSAIIAHQVRNPLAILKNAASNLRRDLRPNDRETLLDILDEETDRLHRLARDLLAYARPVAPRGESVDVEALLRNAYEQARVRFNAAFTLDVRIEGPLMVQGDPELLRHALTNVVDNALEAMPRGGRVRLEARQENGANARVRLDCIDAGEGIPDAVIEKVLDPFFTTKSAGTGLGLTIVDRVVRSHSGQLEIARAQPSGTRVSIILPAAR